MAKKATNKGTFDELNDRIAKEVKLNLPKGKMLVSGSSFYHFENPGDCFIGYPTGQKVIDPNEERTLGYHFANEEGEAWVIGASYSIDKAMNMEILVDDKLTPVYKSGEKLYIRFEGQTTVKKTGQAFNQFTVIQLEQ